MSLNSLNHDYVCSVLHFVRLKLRAQFVVIIAIKDDQTYCCRPFSRSAAGSSLPVSLNTWINESDVVLVIEVGSNLLGDLDESSEGKFVREVLVKVVLVVLKLVHVLNGIVVVSNLWEREGLVVELLGGDSESWGLSGLGKTGGDLHSVVPGGLLEVSGELSKLESELLLGDLEWWWAIGWGGNLEVHDLIESLLVLGNGSSDSSGE